MWRVILAILACLMLQDVQGANDAGADYQNNILAISEICRDVESNFNYCYFLSMRTLTGFLKSKKNNRSSFPLLSQI